MSTSLLYHAFGIRGYRYSRTEYHNGQVIFTIDQEPETQAHHQEETLKTFVSSLVHCLQVRRSMVDQSAWGLRVS